MRAAEGFPECLRAEVKAEMMQKPKQVRSGTFFPAEQPFELPGDQSPRWRKEKPHSWSLWVWRPLFLRPDIDFNWTEWLYSWHFSKIIICLFLFCSLDLCLIKNKIVVSDQDWNVSIEFTIRHFTQRRYRYYKMVLSFNRKYRRNCCAL